MEKKMKKLIIYILASALMLPLISGCDLFDRLKSDYEETQTEVIEGENPAQAEVSNDINIGIVDFDTLNPLLTGSPTMKECLQFVYEPLFDVDEKQRIIPVLADSYTLSPDGRTIEIQLKHGVTWHDGSAFTSQDVAYTFKQIRSGITQYTDNLANVADYMGIDDDKLRITLNYAVPNFVSYLNFPVVKYQTDMSGLANFIPDGTGAFYFSAQLGTGKVLFAAYEGYWGGRASIDSITATVIPDAQKYQSMFDASEIDVITDSLLNLSEYTPRGSVTVNEYVTNKLTYLGFNTQNPLFKGSSTRRAIAKLIDKDSIVNSTLYSRCVAVDTPINPTSVFYYDTNERFKKDEILAMSLLGDDGWGTNANGDFTRITAGETQILSFNILTDADNSEKCAVAEKIAAGIKEFGIACEITALPYEEYKAGINSGNYEAAIDEIILAPNNDLSPLVSSAGNSFGYINPTFDTLTAQLGMTADEEQQKELYRQYGGGVTEEMPFIPLYFRKGYVLSSSKLKNELCPSSVRQYRNTAAWSVK